MQLLNFSYPTVPLQLQVLKESSLWKEKVVVTKKVFKCPYYLDSEA